MRTREQNKLRLPKPVKKILELTLRSLISAAGETERAEKLLWDLESYNTGLNFILGKLNGLKVGLQPSRLLPYISNQTNLGATIEATIEATTGHNPDLARCAQTKRKVLSNIKRNRPGAEAIRDSLLKVPLSTLSEYEGPDEFRSRRERAKWVNRATGEKETVLLEYVFYKEEACSQFPEKRVQEISGKCLLIRS